MRLCTPWRRCWQAVVLPALIQAALLSWVICCIAQLVASCKCWVSRIASPPQLPVWGQARTLLQLTALCTVNSS